MNTEEARRQVDEIDKAVGRALIALHAVDDADDSAARLVALRAFAFAIADVEHRAGQVIVELREIGLTR